MFCSKCGKELGPGEKFCVNCGTPADAVSEVENMPAEQPDYKGGDIQGEYVTENIVRCPDGTYRWIFEFSMLRNPTILITLFKIFGSIILAGFLLLLFMDMRNSWFGMEEFLELLRGTLLFTLFFAVLIIVAYMIVAGIYGWNYIVLFEMNEKEIKHIQMQKQFEKAEAMGWLTAMIGLASNSYTVIGAGIMASARNSSSSVLKHVTKVAAKKSRSTIYVNQGLFHNQVYAADEDFDFVRDFIFDHVPASAKKTG